jgi:hypothetical protein
MKAIDTRHAPRSPGLLWAGILGPPIIWLTQFEVKYALAGTGNSPAHGPALIATSVVAFALILLLTYLAARERRLAGESPLDEAGGRVLRIRFMSTLGFLNGLMFLLVVVAQAIADFYFSPGSP